MEQGKRRRPRRCVGCGTEAPKRGLVRIVRSPEGKVSIDRSGRAPGRGAYLCPKLSCLALAVKRKALQRSLRTEVGSEVIRELEDLLKALEAEPFDGQY
ncbi:putative nucleic-acid-binding protein implicated in transcription termination [Thermanaerovibrio velox DSM 12556]|uniref:Putative nucleic-acid-binding protein implicated in transcription termination n=1 Tax=Thermanaerovibrio velox DSM 12556 TaxID=926567 RepID=H0URL4_9BACT|nr:YlxR family protein [Thermanaerovibrio velox]EHM09953.1 putative nucleic-acid-binding protein implicated in transcription termination [Thermanaerovibrio velox DSM 12556]